MQTIISYSDDGFYDAIQNWGSLLLQKTGKFLHKKEADDTVNYLGYWTDGGAYYVSTYLNTEDNTVYSTMVQ